MGLVLCRGLGGSAACWMSRTSRSMAACRFCSCERYCLASMINVPSEVIRLPASLINRCLTSAGMDGDSWALNRNWTADETLFTFWPPGPGERINTNSISCSSICIDGVISIMYQVYQHAFCCRQNPYIGWQMPVVGVILIKNCFWVKRLSECIIRIIKS